MLKKILCLLLIVVICVPFVGCSNKNEPATLLDFYSYSDVDLFKLTNQKVTIYGYLSLNPAVNKTTYVTEIPYKGFSNPQEEGKENYAKVTMRDHGLIAVRFKEVPEYTSTAIKITGTLESGPFYDDYYFSYNFRIKDAVVEEVDTAYMDTTLRMFNNLATQGYNDVLYKKILDLEVIATEGGDFPKFDEYEKVKAEFEGKTKNQVEIAYLTVLDRIDEIYKKYKDVYGADTFDKDVFAEDIINLYASFTTYVMTYGGITPV